MSDFKHYTVMLNEAVDALECQDGKIYVDCTLGGGGHSELILKRISPNGKLIAFDIDDEAIAHAKERLKEYKNLTIVKIDVDKNESLARTHGIMSIPALEIYKKGTLVSKHIGYASKEELEDLLK